MPFIFDGKQYTNTADVQAVIGYELINKTDILPADFVLDVGCGIGNLTLDIAEKASAGHVVGIDISESMIKKCIENAINGGIQNAEFFVSDLSEISYDKKFDLIFSNSVFHWIRNSERVLEKFLRALKPEGRIAIQFPLLNEKHPLIYFTNKTIEKLNMETIFTDWDFPWYVPSECDFQQLLANIGFINVNVMKTNSTYRFKGAKEVYEFFRSIGLQLYLHALPEAQTELFEQTLHDLIAQSESDGYIDLFFERVFAAANR